MFMEDLKLDFSGFRPSRDDLHNVRGWIFDLWMAAPSDSLTTATFRRVQNGTQELFEGVLRISSSMGVFLAEERDHDLLRLVERLGGVIGGQLERWKRDRFEFGDGEKSDRKTGLG